MLTKNAKRIVSEGINHAIGIIHKNKYSGFAKRGKDFSSIAHKEILPAVNEYFFEWYNKQVNYNNYKEIYELDQTDILHFVEKYYDLMLPAIFLNRICEEENIKKITDNAPSGIKYNINDFEYMNEWIFRFDSTKKEIFNNNDDAPTINQLKYIKSICKKLKMELPIIITKQEASEWLEKYIKIYDYYKKGYP